MRAFETRVIANCTEIQNDKKNLISRVNKKRNKRIELVKDRQTNSQTDRQTDRKGKILQSPSHKYWM